MFLKNIASVTGRDAAVVLIAFLAVAFQMLVVDLSPLGLAGDEAYYWMWSKHLDFSYYEKGPGIALLIRLGCWIFGDTQVGVRFGAGLCQFFITIVLYFFISRHVLNEQARQHAGTSNFFFQAPGILLLYWSSLNFGTLGIFMTCDPPLLLMWLVSLIAATFAVQRNKTNLWWFAFAAVGLGALSKYAIFILIPSFAMFLLFTKARRHHLWSIGFVGGALLSVVMLLPVFYWNSQHDWINFTHNSGHFQSNERSIGLSHVAELVFGQWGLAGFLLFPLFVGVVGKAVRRWTQGDLFSGLAVSTIIPLAVLCLTLSFTRSVYANWPMPIFLGCLLLVSHLWASGEFGDRQHRLFKQAAIVNFALLGVSHLLFTGYGLGIPPRLLPSNKLVGWPALGASVASLLLDPTAIPRKGSSGEHASASGTTTDFVLSNKYTIASEIGFYTHTDKPIVVSKMDKPRLTQFDVWDDWRALRGKNALLVFDHSNDWEYFKDEFQAIKPAVPATLPIPYGGKIQRTFYFYHAFNFSGKDMSSATRLGLRLSH